MIFGVTKKFLYRQDKLIGLLDTKLAASRANLVQRTTQLYRMMQRNHVQAEDLSKTGTELMEHIYKLPLPRAQMDQVEKNIDKLIKERDEAVKDLKGQSGNQEVKLVSKKGINPNYIKGGVAVIFLIAAAVLLKVFVFSGSTTPVTNGQDGENIGDHETARQNLLIATCRAMQLDADRAQGIAQDTLLSPIVSRMSSVRR